MKNPIATNILFAGQQSPDDCGIACLAMILNYAGKYKESEKLQQTIKAANGGLSLLELRELASDAGFNSRCVSMDIITLRDMVAPCILHVLNDAEEHHFLVCFGLSKYRRGYKYLIGDPATGVHFMAEADLCEVWQSHAALYFENLSYGRPHFKDHPWLALLQINALRSTLFISVPLLNLSATIMGIALSWLLQRGINDSLANKKDSFVIAVLLLLLMIMMFRCLGIYLRERILIRLNREVRNKFTSAYLTGLFCQGTSADKYERAVKKGLNDIQRIQNAVAALLSVLISDGSMLTLIISGLCYFEPVIGLINVLYTVIAVYTGIRASAEIGFLQSELSEIAAGSEQSLLEGLTSPAPDQKMLNLQLSNQTKTLNKSGILAIKISRYNLHYDCLGVINVIAVLLLSIDHIRKQQISYNMLLTEVILSYFVTALLPKICNVFPVITAGARSIRRFKKA